MSCETTTASSTGEEEAWKFAIISAMAGSRIAHHPAIQADAGIEDKAPKPDGAGAVDVMTGIELRRRFADGGQAPARHMRQVVMLQGVAQIDADPVDDAVVR